MDNVTFRLLSGPLYTHVLDFIKSKNFETTLSKYHEKLGTIHCGDPTILLTNAIEYLRRTEKCLQKERREQQLKRKQLVKEYIDFEAKEKTFRKNFIRFDKFIKENQEKRVRGQSKISEDIYWADKREHDTAVIQESYAKFLDAKVVLEDQIKHHNIYEKYLNTACEESDNFKQPMDAIERYEALLETRNILGQKQESDLIALENAKANLSKLAEAKNLIIIGLNTKMFGLEARYESSRYRSLINENLIMDIFEKACERISEISGTKQNILQMYKEMNQAKQHFKSYTAEDFESQLTYIKSTLAQFSKINKYFKKKGEPAKQE